MVKEWEGPVYLEPIEHKYWHRETGKRYSSVTQTLHSLVNEFDADAVSTAISKQPEARRKEEYKGLNKQQILDYWQFLNDEANEYGTFIHESIERYLLNQKFYFPDDELEQKAIKAFDDIAIDEGQCIWPERIMFSEEHQLAGTADLIIDIDDTFFDVGDFKTNRKFDYHDAFGFKTLKKPLDHLQDCHYSIYSVQLSIYALMYEMETGRKCRKNYILYWNRETEKFEYIPVPYYKNEAKKVLDLHKYNTQFAI
jgi:CRISPR/Cas system-associated exonuclease Cas4 (RecB family)